MISRNIGRTMLAALTLGVPLIATPAFATLPAPRPYANCTALNKVYPHGVGKAKTTVDHTTGVRVTNFYVNAKLYALNDGRVLPNQYDLDRDNDGIACEKR